MLIYILYFIVIAVLAVEYEFSRFRSWIPLVVVIMMLGLLAGLKGPLVARDYDSYLYSFNAVYIYLDELKNGRPLTFFEPAYLLVVAAIRSFSELNYPVFIFLFFAIASLIVKVKAIKSMSVNPYLVLLFYFSHYYVLLEMTQIRIGFASAIFFAALYQYVKGNRINFVLLVLIAAGFHYSALLYLMVFLFNCKSINRYIYGCILVVCVVLALSKFPLFEIVGGINPELITGKLKGYENISKGKGDYSINVFNVVYIANILCIVYLIFFVPKAILEKSREMLLFIKCNILSVFLLSLMSGTPLIAFRLSELFGVTSVFMFAGVLYYLPTRQVRIIVPLLLAAIFFYINYFHNDIIQPYYITNFR